MNNKPTNERLEEIRKHWCCECDDKSCKAFVELFAEIDALNEEVSGLYADLTGQEHRLGIQLDSFQVELNDLSLVNKNCADTVFTLSQERDELHKYKVAALKEMLKIKEENTQFRDALDKMSDLECQILSLVAERDQIAADYKEYKIYYDRIFSKSIVVPTEEYITNVEFTDRIKKLKKALQHTNDFCLCEREINGFDYGELHPHMGKPKPGSRWLTPRDVAEKALADDDDYTQ